jgi:hypothetical protein
MDDFYQKQEAGVNVMKKIPLKHYATGAIFEL